MNAKPPFIGSQIPLTPVELKKRETALALACQATTTKPLAPSVSLQGIERSLRAIHHAGPGQEAVTFKTEAPEAFKDTRADGIGVAMVADRLQQVAEAVGLVRDFGQDDVQAWIAEAARSKHPAANMRAAHPKPWEAGLDIVCLADVRAKGIDWLWPNRIPLGKVTVLAGEGGLGKSTILCDLAARVTTGTPWPDGASNGRAGTVLILAAEDALDDTIKPRLHAAGANMSKVHCVVATREDRQGVRRAFNFQADLEKLERAIELIGDVVLVIIDPISSYLGKLDSHKNDQVRAVLDPLGQLATRCRAAFICNNHFSKAAGRANSRVVGSVAFVNQARAVFIVSEDPDDESRRLLLPSKTNLGPIGHGLGYRIRGVKVGLDGADVEMSQVEWDSVPVTMSADTALARVANSIMQHSELSKAKEFLVELLTAGPLPQKELKAAAKEADISERTLKRAKKELGVLADRIGGIGADGKWIWKLPPQVHQ